MIKCEVRNLKSPVFTIETSGEHLGGGGQLKTFDHISIQVANA